MDLCFHVKRFIPHQKDGGCAPKQQKICAANQTRSSQIVYCHAKGKLYCHTKQTGLLDYDMLDKTETLTLHKSDSPSKTANVVQTANSDDEQIR
jgi:hypothetical protein